MSIDIKEQIKDCVDIEQVVDRLGGLNLQKCGQSLQGPCPTGHPSKEGRCFSVNLAKNYFNCFHCAQASGDIISLVMLINRVDFKEALIWLAENFRPDLLPQINKYQGEQTLDLQQYYHYQKAALFDLIAGWGKDLLYQAPGEKALNYLITDFFNQS